jgi:dTDP-4-amino-4,6-dideoxygalactose transaminase
VVYCGGTPVFADVGGAHDLSLDPADVERKLTPRTKAVCVVHFAGYPAPIRELAELCADRGVALIEDAAHAPSAHVCERKLGTWGLAGAFSFFSNKVLACGEGGLVATDDDDVARLARSLRNQGMSSDSWQKTRRLAQSYDADAVGFNYRLDEPRAALLLSRFRGLEGVIARRRALTRDYRRKLADVPALSVPYTEDSIERSSCYVMPVLVDDAERRDGVRRRLRERHGVQTSLFYPAVHEFTAYRRRFGAVSVPHSEHVARTEITLPLFPEMEEADQDRVVEALAVELA